MNKRSLVVRGRSWETGMYEYRPGGRGVRAAVIRGLCRIFVLPTLRWWPLRGPLARLMPLVDVVFRPVPRLAGTEYEPVRGAGWRGELVRPCDAATGGGAILYLHGGAFLFCGLASHRRIVERLALRTGLPVLSVAYRHLPKQRLDVSIADATDAFGWLVARGVPAESIVCIGDSAGGHLAFALAFHAARTGAGRPAGVVAMSPWLDFDNAAKSAHDNARRDVFIPATRLDRVAALLTGSEHSAAIDPLRSPVNLDPGVLPPVLIQCAEDEVLRCDAELMADRLSAAGIENTLQIWQGQVHAFPVLADLLPESRAALDDIAAFTTRVLPTPPAKCA
ncbi:acetyl esterase/lipase [Nocardia transvalensis]|uniref:Acetyl esterase/lipase n=1 Tax=Nocardia transvalensis TaxID=37333 RepID=A0A7W9UME5_9NOCA|nr:alpha/beta hydrolase [Nocardia transvalensis]MBB5918287.1 acetyl esterase/lipase [Nocardia transvalensis]